MVEDASKTNLISFLAFDIYKTGMMCGSFCMTRHPNFRKMDISETRENENFGKSRLSQGLTYHASSCLIPLAILESNELRA